MKFFLDLTKKQLVKSAASNVALDRVVLKRRDSIDFDLAFVQRNAVVEMPLGTTFSVALKRTFADTNFLAFAAPGATNLNLYTEPVEAAFSSNPASIAALLEIRWTVPGETTRNATLAVDLQNSVILGSEATPAAVPDGKATQAEAEAGTSNEKWMTPLRTAQAIAELAPPPTWASVLDKPATFPPSSHTHPTSQITGLDPALSALATAATLESATRIAADFALNARIDNLAANLDPAAIDSVAEAAATILTERDERIAGDLALGLRIDGKAPTSHTHTANHITDFASAVVAVSPPVDWSSLTGKPTTFPPSAHTHPASQITGLSDFVIAAAPGLSITTTVHIATGATRTYSVAGLASPNPSHVLVQLNGVTQTPITDYLIDFPNGLIIFDGTPVAGTQIALTALGLRTVQPPINPALYRYASDTSANGLINYYGRISNTDYTGLASASSPLWTIHRTTFDAAGRVVSKGTATSVAWTARTTATYTATP